MKILIKGGTVLKADGRFAQNCPILLEDDRILAVGPEANAEADADKVIDAAGRLILPGLVDVHTHGRSGYDFSTATEEEMERMKQDYAHHGVTSVFATLASDTTEGWLRSIEAIQNCGFDGIHLEGCYLNPKKRGAHASHLLVPLDVSNLETVLASIHIPCHLTAAFELDEDGSFAACAKAHGITMGLGHTNANAEEARMALSRGVASFTHLYNTMPPLHHRDGGAVAVALCSDTAYGELIADGMHICPEMIALAYKCLGEERTVLITDSMEATGCGDGEYGIAGQPVIVKNGKALTLDGALAGSTLELWQGVQNLMKFAGISLEKAVCCASRNPAKMVGIYDRVGSIEVGKRADLLFVNETGEQILSVMAGGAFTDAE